MSSRYHKKAVERIRQKEKYQKLTDFMMIYGPKIEIYVSSKEELYAVKERFSLPEAWGDIEERSQHNLLFPLTLIISLNFLGEYKFDWCHGFSAETLRGANVHFTELFTDPLNKIVQEIRKEIHE